MLPVSWRLKEEGFEIISRTSRRYPGDKQFGLLNKIRELLKCGLGYLCHKAEDLDWGGCVLQGTI